MCIDSWMTRTVPGCSRCQGYGYGCCRPCPRPSPPNPLWSHLLLVSWCFGVNWPPSGRKTLSPRSLGNWSHPFPLVSWSWSAMDYSQRAAATLFSLDQLSAAWWSATGCALLLIQPTKIEQKLTVSLDFRSTAAWWGFGGGGSAINGANTSSFYNQQGLQNMQDISETHSCNCFVLYWSEL